MRAFFLIVSIFLSTQAQAQSVPLPTCWPSQIRGTGGDAVYRETDTAEGVGWRCGSAAPYRYVRVCRLKGVSITAPPTDGLTGIGAARAFWLANVRADCRDPQFVALDNLILEALIP